MNSLSLYMNNFFNSMTIRSIVIGQMFYFIVLTWGFFKAMTFFSDKGLSYFLNLNNDSIWFHHYSLGPLNMIYIIPAALISMLLIYVALIVFYKFMNSRAVRKLAPFANKYRFFKFFQIERAEQGKWYSSFLFPIKVTKLVFIIVAAAFGAVIAGIFAIAAFLSSSVSVNSGRSSHYVETYNNDSDAAYNKKKLKKEANFQATQKQKEANYAAEQARKQAAYNMNSPHFDKRLNVAEQKQREADATAKRARNL